MRLLAAVGMVGCAAGQLTCAVTDPVGCYTDFTDGKTRDLAGGPYDVSKMTQEACASVCFRRGLQLSGVEYGTQCFCGNSLVAGAKVDDSACAAMKCAGNSSQACGAANRLWVYKAACTGTPLPNYHACVDDKAKALPYCDTSKSIDDRVEDLVSRLSLDEQIDAISPQAALGDTCGTHTAGKASIGLPNYYWLVETNTAVASACYGPEQCATTFIGPMGLGASFNRTNWRLKGGVLGTEMRAFQNAGWHRANAENRIALTGFGPNINIARDPRFGRSSELPGEDPFLSGTYAKEMVQGMQEKDSRGYPKMLAYLKHFTAYSRETDRGRDTYNISMHDLHETYLAQYKIAFTEGQATGAMCSYDAENGNPSCANGYILNEVIRKQWDRPDAHITTDCGAVNNLLYPPVRAPNHEAAAAMAINNGTDLEMGSLVWSEHLGNAVKQGLTTADAVRQSAKRAFTVLMRAGRFDPVSQVSWTSLKPDQINSTYHQQIGREAALQGMVLLRNEGGVLPLRKGAKLAVIGPMGQATDGLLSDYAGDQQCFGGVKSCITTVANAVAAANAGGSTTQAKGCDVNSADKSGIAPAVALAKAADVVVLVLGNDRTQEHEALDRKDTALPGQQPNLAAQVLATGKPVVLVLCNGGAIAFDSVMTGIVPRGIIEAFNPSLQGSAALADLMFGSENRWGKLPVTLYPHDFIAQNPMTNYDMSKPPGRTYRYYTGQPLYPFGYGLSLTNFTLSCSATPGSLPFKVTCQVANVGRLSGDEVVMQFHSAGADVRAEAKHPCPLKSLVGFERVRLAAGETTTVEFDVTADTVSLVDEDGKSRQYKGQHVITFSRGHGPETSFNVTV